MVWILQSVSKNNLFLEKSNACGNPSSSKIIILIFLNDVIAVILVFKTSLLFLAVPVPPVGPPVAFSRCCGSCTPSLVSPAERPLSGGDAEGEEDAPGGEASSKRKRRRRKKKRRPAAARDSSSDSGSSSSSSSGSGSTNRSAGASLVETPSQFSPGELGVSDGGPQEGGEWLRKCPAWCPDEYILQRQRVEVERLRFPWLLEAGVRLGTSSTWSTMREETGWRLETTGTSWLRREAVVVSGCLRVPLRIRT